MSNNRFRDAMGHIDDHLLERCDAYEQQLTKKKRIRLQSAVAVAACIALILGTLLFAPRNVLPESVDPPIDSPAADSPAASGLFSANDIAALFPRGDGLTVAGTSTAVYAPNEDALGLIPIPDADSLPIFLRTQTEDAITEESIRAFADGILPKVAQALGGTVPEYTVDVLTEKARFETDIGTNRMIVTKSNSLNYFGIQRSFYRNPNATTTMLNAYSTTTTLNGQIVQIDQTQTNEEIIASLSDIHQILQDIFGVNLPDAKVVRTYNEDSDYGCTVIQVYFYDEDANYLNTYTERPVSDNIELWFYNNPLFMKDQLSKDILQYVDINYRDWRTEEGDQYKQNGTAEMLSLQDAEALLKKGYSFGGHSCEICYPVLNGVDFTDYDAVSFTYYWSSAALSAGKTPYIPFYVFYKQIGTAKNGNNIYAKTYVPAVYVSGLEAYFRNQH